MLFHKLKRQPTFQPDIRISNKSINEVQNIKFLGVILDNKLSWKEHIGYSTSKMSKCVGILHKAKPF